MLDCATLPSLVINHISQLGNNVALMMHLIFEIFILFVFPTNFGVTLPCIYDDMKKCLVIIAGLKTGTNKGINTSAKR